MPSSKFRRGRDKQHGKNEVSRALSDSSIYSTKCIKYLGDAKLCAQVWANGNTQDIKYVGENADLIFPTLPLL